MRNLKEWKLMRVCICFDAVLSDFHTMERMKGMNISSQTSFTSTFNTLQLTHSLIITLLFTHILRPFSSLILYLPLHLTHPSITLTHTKRERKSPSLVKTKKSNDVELRRTHSEEDNSVASRGKWEEKEEESPNKQRVVECREWGRKGRKMEEGKGEREEEERSENEGRRWVSKVGILCV